MANSDKKSGYRRVHSGKARQVSRILCEQLREGHSSDRTDTRVGNPLFHASTHDIDQYRSAKARPTPT